MYVGFIRSWCIFVCNRVIGYWNFRFNIWSGICRFRIIEVIFISVIIFFFKYKYIFGFNFDFSVVNVKSLSVIIIINISLNWFIIFYNVEVIFLFNDSYFIFFCFKDIFR